MLPLLVLLDAFDALIKPLNGNSALAAALIENIEPSPQLVVTGIRFAAVTVAVIGAVSSASAFEFTVVIGKAFMLVKQNRVAVGMPSKFELKTSNRSPSTNPKTH